MADEVRVITMNTGTSAQWANQARPLETGEFGYDSTTGELKIGNGTASWAQLPSRKGFIELPQADFESLPTKDPSTLYLVNSGVTYNLFLGANPLGASGAVMRTIFTDG